MLRRLRLNVRFPIFPNTKKYHKPQTKAKFRLTYTLNNLSVKYPTLINLKKSIHK